MDRPVAEIEGCQLAHDRLRSSLADMTEGHVRGPSLLPEWSRAHVLSHLAGNAEAMIRRIEAALEGRSIEQYPGGPEGRATAIEVGSQGSATDLISLVSDTSTRLDALFASLSDEAWGLPIRTVGGSQHPVGLLPFRRWREVEVHLVDLDLSFAPADWSPLLIERALPRLVAGLTNRTDQVSLTAWLLGRGPAPDLEPWA